MAGSSFGTVFKLTTFGESHGLAIGGVIDGFPSDFSFDFDAIQTELDRRKPGQSKIVSQRKEDDQVKFLSGIFEGKTTGAPIAFIIDNMDAKSKDYEHIKEAYRPSHADYTYSEKYANRDYRGGGRSSARETVARVVAGALAKQYLLAKGIDITSFVDQIGPIKMSDKFNFDKNKIEESLVRCPDLECAKQMEDFILKTKKDGDSVGGSVFTFVNGVPVGLGEPVFDKLHAKLGQAMLSINAVKGFEIGSGFSAIEMLGSEHNDVFNSDFSTKTNNSGGILGGISNGMPIYFRTAFKPVATLLKDQDSVDKDGNYITLKGKGRHDPCVVPRAVPIVEAMTAIVLLDFYLIQKAYQK